MAAPLVFQREWTVEINEMFNDDDDHPLPSTAAILRVPAPMRKMKPEAFIPQLLSLGPYHRSKLEKFIDSPCAELKISMAERYKVKSAVTLSHKLCQSGKDFKCIVAIMNQMRPEIESFYGLPSSTESEYSKNFALMMAVDSSFLLQFLNYMYGLQIAKLTLDPATQSFFGTYFICIMHDILKLENQIPLSVLKEVLDYVKETIGDERHPWSAMCWKMSPFLRSMPTNLFDEMEKEPHILGCTHTSLSQILQIKYGVKRQNGLMEILKHKFNGILKNWIGGLLPAVPDTAVLFSQGMCARQLVTAGFKFKTFTNFPDYIGLDKDSGTLYLPHICLNDIVSEVWLRNMLALEFNDALRPKYVTRYVDLMGHLIQSPDDVRILVDQRVISAGFFHLSNEYLVKMWHDLRQPFIIGSETKVHAELFDALCEWAERSYWKNEIKRKVCGVYDFVLSWKFVAPVATFLALLMTAIQTYCSLYHCSR